MKYESIVLDSEESQRQAILNNLGRKVVLDDFHYGHHEGVLSKKGYDKEVYRFKDVNNEEEFRFWYHDLEKLSIIRKYIIHPVPEGFRKYPVLFRIHQV